MPIISSPHNTLTPSPTRSPHQDSPRMACKVPEVSSLVKETQEVFSESYGGPAEVAAVAPGRVNIIGEHTDYNDGFVFPMVSENIPCLE